MFGPNNDFSKFIEGMFKMTFRFMIISFIAYIVIVISAIVGLGFLSYYLYNHLSVSFV